MNKYLEKVAEIVEGLEKEAANQKALARALRKSYGSEEEGGTALGALFARKHRSDLKEAGKVVTKAKAKVNPNMEGTRKKLQEKFPSVMKGTDALDRNLTSKSRRKAGKVITTAAGIE